MQEKKIKDFDSYKKEYEKSIENPEGFWEEKANNFLWKKKWARKSCSLAMKKLN